MYICLWMYARCLVIHWHLQGNNVGSVQRARVLVQWVDALQRLNPSQGNYRGASSSFLLQLTIVVPKGQLNPMPLSFASILVAHTLICD